MYELSEYFRFHISTAKISECCPKSWDMEEKKDEIYRYLLIYLNSLKTKKFF